MLKMSSRLHLLFGVAIVLALGIVTSLFYRNHLAGVPDPTFVVNSQVVVHKDPGIKCSGIAELSEVRLFVSGMDTGIPATGCVDDSSTIVIPFRHVKPNGLSDLEDRAVWETILGHPLQTIRSGRVLEYDVRWIKAGNDFTYLTQPRQIAVVRIFEAWAPMAVAAIAIVWLLLIHLGKNTALLRDASVDAIALDHKTFSLARTQMAWWFGIIFAAFVFLWLVTGETPSLSAQALSLLGISTVTTITANNIGPRQASGNGRIGVFFQDLISDATGVTIHRFQMLIMTATLGVLFLFEVLTSLRMPEFDPSLLTLMGLSSGAYVLMKIPEAKGDDTGTETSAGDAKNGYTPQ